MPKRFHLNQPDHAKALADALATCQDISDQQRLLAMRLAASGQLTAAQIAEQLGISRRSVLSNWVSALKEGGIEGLLRREHGGGPAHRGARSSGARRVSSRLESAAYQWKRAKEIQHWLRSEHQVKLGLKGVYYWLGKLGGVLKVPRKTHAQKDAAKAVEFQQQLCAKLKNLNVAGGKPVRIWVSDEHRYGPGDPGRAQALDVTGRTADGALSNS